MGVLPTRSLAGIEGLKLDGFGTLGLMAFA
jgi:hypothetical protein